MKKMSNKNTAITWNITEWKRHSKQFSAFFLHSRSRADLQHNFQAKCIRLKKSLKFITDAPDGLSSLTHWGYSLSSMLVLCAAHWVLFSRGLYYALLLLAICKMQWQLSPERTESPARVERDSRAETDNFDFDGLPYKREKKKGGNKKFKFLFEPENSVFGAIYRFVTEFQLFIWLKF